MVFQMSTTRSDRLRRLAEETHDVLILGGGINGAGIVRDLALRARLSGRPLKLALVDKAHFSSGTSGKNSQLIHGGLRYLKYMEFRLVREALQERSTLLEIAPHLVEPLPFLIPMYSYFAKVFYGTGLWMYDTLAGQRNISKHRAITLDEVKRLEPGLKRDDLVSAAIFYDGRVHSARFVLENLREAEDGGAVLANYVSAHRFGREAGEWRVEARDELTGTDFTIRARQLVNTTGPWAGESFPAENKLRLVRGSHLILPRLNRSDNAIAYFEQDGRIIFFIPWGSRADLTLVGTTDVDHDGAPDNVHISEAETEYLMGIAQSLFPESRGMQPVASYSSLRPLVRDDSGSATATSREHRIWRDAEGIVHVSGGKYTTYRVMSEEAADLALETISPELVTLHETARHALNGNTRERIGELLGQARTAEERHIVKDYGVRAPHVLERARTLGSFEAAQIEEARTREWVERRRDLMEVSTYWAHEGRRVALPEDLPE
jgi:glycerol-3-phosphate dehydrogenase